MGEVPTPNSEMNAAEGSSFDLNPEHETAIVSVGLQVPCTVVERLQNLTNDIERRCAQIAIIDEALSATVGFRGNPDNMTVLQAAFVHRDLLGNLLEISGTYERDFVALLLNKIKDEPEIVEKAIRVSESFGGHPALLRTLDVAFENPDGMEATMAAHREEVARLLAEQDALFNSAGRAVYSGAIQIAEQAAIAGPPAEQPQPAIIPSEVMSEETKPSQSLEAVDYKDLLRELRLRASIALSNYTRTLIAKPNTMDPGEPFEASVKLPQGKCSELDREHWQAQFDNLNKLEDDWRRVRTKTGWSGVAQLALAQSLIILGFPPYGMIDKGRRAAKADLQQTVTADALDIGSRYGQRLKRLSPADQAKLKDRVVRLLPKDTEDVAGAMVS